MQWNFILLISTLFKKIFFLKQIQKDVSFYDFHILYLK